MALTFRRDLSRNLTAAEGDGNMDDLNGRLLSLEGTGSAGSITSWTLAGSVQTLHFSDASTISLDIGPANAYVMGDHLRGVWQPSLSYLVNDVFYYQGTLYCVIYPHTSAGTFDEAAQSAGHDVYRVIVRYGDGVGTITTATLTPTTQHTNKYLRCTNAGGCVITLNGNVFGPADRLAFRQSAAGGLTFVAGAGVTINGLAGYGLTTSIQGAVVQIEVVGAAAYDLWGLMDLL
jgi:hypothetical protein